MVALDGLVQKGPYLVGALGRRGAVAAQEDEGSQAHHGRAVVKEGVLGGLDGARGGIGVDAGHGGKRAQDLPAGLGLGALKGGDKGVGVGNHRRRVLLGKGGQLVGDLLTVPSAGRRKILYQQRDLLGIISHAKTSSQNYLDEPRFLAASLASGIWTLMSSGSGVPSRRARR